MRQVGARPAHFSSWPQFKLTLLPRRCFLPRLYGHGAYMLLSTQRCPPTPRPGATTPRTLFLRGSQGWPRPLFLLSGSREGGASPIPALKRLGAQVTLGLPSKRRGSAFSLLIRGYGFRNPFLVSPAEEGSAPAFQPRRAPFCVCLH